MIHVSNYQWNRQACSLRFQIRAQQVALSLAPSIMTLLLTTKSYVRLGLVSSRCLATARDVRLNPNQGRPRNLTYATVLVKLYVGGGNKPPPYGWGSTPAASSLIFSADDQAINNRRSLV
jgi:hypothetical protein